MKKAIDTLKKDTTSKNVEEKHKKKKNQILHDNLSSCAQIESNSKKILICIILLANKI